MENRAVGVRGITGYCLQADMEDLVFVKMNFQGTSCIAALIEHCTRGTPTGRNISICIEDLVLEAGYFGPLWHIPFDAYEKWCSLHSWIVATCAYCFDHNIILHLDHLCLCPK